MESIKKRKVSNKGSMINKLFCLEKNVELNIKKIVKNIDKEWKKIKSKCKGGKE